MIGKMKKSGTVLATLHFFRKVRLAKLELKYNSLEMLVRDKHWSLLDPFKSYKENQVL
jgi:hypothetical protein